MATITYTVTVANSGSGNVYYIDGAANPALTFARGNTYVFNLSDNSNSGHPLAFKDSFGNSYTDDVTTTGTAGSSGANVTIVVDNQTPTPLRYYCTVHGEGMGNTIDVTGVGTITYTTTVAAPSGYNLYVIEGSNAPVLTFVRGNTYVFDLSANSNSGHPLAFKDSVGNSYTTGVTTTGTAGSNGASVSIVTNASTPTGLRYYCTVHGNAMGNTISVPVVDAYVGLYGSGEYGSAAFGVVPSTSILSSVSATGSIGTVTTTMVFQITGVSGTGQVGSATFANDTSLTLSSVSATGAVGTLSENPSEAITGVSATGIIGSVFASALFGANDGIYGTGRYGIARYDSSSPTINFPSISATGAVASVGVGASENLANVSATVTIGVIRTIPFILRSVSATGAVGTVSLVTSAGVTGVSATGAIEQVQVDGFEIDVQERLASVSATGGIGTLTHSNTHSIASAVGTFSLGSLTATGVTFNFVAADYDRKRVVYVPRQDTAAERRVAA